MSKTSGYLCDYCQKPIDLKSTEMITRHLVPGDWLDPLYEQTELHFHVVNCHYQFSKVEDRAKEAARANIQGQLAKIAKS